MQSSAQSRTLVSGVCLGLVAITWIVFGQTLRHDFVNYDDDAYIHERPEIVGGITLRGLGRTFTRSYVSNWQPLTAISHMLDCQFFGLRPSGHHFTSVVLHTIAVLLLFFVLRQLTGGLWRSALLAALFAIHPLHVESVAWIAERKDVLSAVFFMLTLGAYIRYVRQLSIARYVTMSILFALGLMSKPMLVTLPFVLLLLDYWPLQRMLDLRDLRRLVVEKIPLLVMSAAASLITLFTQTEAIRPLEHLPIAWRIENAFVSVITYIWRTVWPVNLAVFYPHPRDQIPSWLIAFSVAFVLGMSLAAVLIGRKRKYVPVGWFWYLGMLVPVLGFVQVGLQGYADRYAYLPNIGLYLLLTWAIVDLAKRWRFRRQILAVAATIALVALIYCARAQASYWRNSETLWHHTLDVTANNDVAHTNLGNLLPAAEAVPHYEKALQIAPHTMLPLNNLAWIRATSPDPFQRDGAKALELAKEANQLSGGKDPVFVRTLAAAYAENGQFTEAIETAQRALPLAVAQDNSALASDLRNNIDNFRRNIPVRDPSLANAHP